MENVLHRSLGGRPYRTIYVPDVMTPDQMTLVVRANGPTAAVVNPVRETILDVDADQPVLELGSYEEAITAGVTDRRFVTTLITVFAGIGLALAAVGLYGVVALLTGGRTREIAVRMALGSHPKAVLRLVMAQGLRLALFGAAAGSAGGYVLARVMESILFEVTATDPMTFLSAPVVLLTVSFLAAYLPAHRASKVDPAVSLRQE